MPTPASDSTALPNPRLAAVAGPREGEVFEIGKDSLGIGRQSSNRIQLFHESVSRRHCTILRTEEGSRLRDLDSLCGTFVNGVPVSEKLLEHRDFLKVGDSLFLYLSRQEDTPPTDASPFLDHDREVGSTVEFSVRQGFALDADTLQASLEDRDRLARQLSALLRFSTEAHTLETSEALFCRLAEHVQGIVPAQRVAVLTAEGEDFHLAHSALREGQESAHRLSRTLCRRVLDQRVAVLCNDVAADPELASAESLDGSAVRSVLCLPLVAPGPAGAALGVIYADTGEKRARFDKNHLEWLAAAAGVAGPALQHLRRTEALQAENRRFRTAQLDHDIVGESPALARVLGLVARVAPSDLTVLVLGESGTGKELLAQAIHRNSPRAEQPFVAVNCATLSETLLESELFGHEKGAFTGAVGRKLGHFELAHHGTLFLDEVGEIPVALQARLLRALENREIQRVGGSRPLPVDVRVVAATNRNLEEAIRQGTFREDLYHRLNVFALTLPPLRERREDIPLLARHFLARSAQRLHRPISGLSPQARAALVAYDWPGNVRELRNAMERAVVLATEEWLLPEDLPEAVLETAADAAPEGGYHEAVAEAKRRILRAALQTADGSFSAAAEALGLNRTYLHRLVSNLGLRDAFNTR
jgi:transcriptional regulator with GAF, ATPase, and Fis domain